MINVTNKINMIKNDTLVKKIKNKWEKENLDLINIIIQKNYSLFREKIKNSFVLMPLSDVLEFNQINEYSQFEIENLNDEIEDKFAEAFNFLYDNYEENKIFIDNIVENILEKNSNLNFLFFKKYFTNTQDKKKLENLFEKLKSIGQANSIIDGILLNKNTEIGLSLIEKMDSEFIIKSKTIPLMRNQEKGFFYNKILWKKYFDLLVEAIKENKVEHNEKLSVATYRLLSWWKNAKEEELKNYTLKKTSEFYNIENQDFTWLFVCLEKRRELEKRYGEEFKLEDFHKKLNVKFGFSNKIRESTYLKLEDEINNAVKLIVEKYEAKKCFDFFREIKLEENKYIELKNYIELKYNIENKDNLIKNLKKI